MIKKNFIIKVLVEISRIILGVTFIFSGFVKAVDPFGTAYKIEDYLAAFDFSSLSFLALPASALLCIVEFAMGGMYAFRALSQMELAIDAISDGFYDSSHIVPCDSRSGR